MNISQSSQVIIDNQLLQQVVKLKVELQKCRSQIEGYRQMQQGYKKVSMRSELMEKQLLQYQQIMGMFFDRVKKFMILLQIDTNNNMGSNNNRGQYQGKYNQSFNNDSNNIDYNNYNNNYNNNNNESISFINLKTEHNPAFSRRVNKLNSLKTIAHSYISNNNNLMGDNNKNTNNMTDNNNHNNNNISFYQQDNNFSLIQNRIKGLLRQNTQYKQTLQQYQKSSMNISLNIKQHQLIVKKLQSQIRMKDKQIQQTQLHIGQLLKKIQQMKDQLKTKQQLISNYQQQQQHLIKAYQQLASKIQQLKGENSIEEERKVIVRDKCQQLIAQLQTSDDNYLLNYLIKDPLVIKSATQQSTPKTFNNYIANNLYKMNYQNNQYFSQAGGRNYHTQHSLSNSQRNKHNFVFD